MSIIRAIKHRLGLSVTPANNFVLTAEADNGTMKLARESGQDIMTVDAAGKPRFNQLAQSLSGNGYKVLEGGLIVQWGFGVQELDGSVVIPFPTAFPVGPVSITATMFSVPGGFGYATIVDSTISNFTVETRTAAGVLAQINFFWIAIGR